MLKADLGDFLYIIIAVVLMLAGGLEKYVKAKRQQQNQTPLPPQQHGQPHDDFDEEEDEPNRRHAPPQTLEEMVKRMLQTVEPQEEEKDIAVYPEEAQSLETIVSEREPVKNYYQPVNYSDVLSISEKEAFTPAVQDEEKIPVFNEYEFDIRNAIIASEILNRKY